MFSFDLSDLAKKSPWKRRAGAALVVCVALCRWISVSSAMDGRSGTELHLHVSAARVKRQSQAGALNAQHSTSFSLVPGFRLNLARSVITVGLRGNTKSPVELEPSDHTIIYHIFGCIHLI